MIRSNFILLIMCLLIFTISGYTQIQIGPLVGTNLSGISINPDVPGRNINTKTGITAGGTIIYNFSSMFSIQSEPAYMQKGAKIYTPYTDFGLILEIEQTIEANYIDVPILFRVSFEGNFVKPYLLAGGYVAFPLENGKTTLDDLVGNGQNITELLPNEILDLFKPELKTNNFDYGINIGAGIDFPLSIFNLFIQAQYTFGLNKLTDEEFFLFPELLKPDIKNKGLQIKTGILFSFQSFYNTL